MRPVLIFPLLLIPLSLTLAACSDRKAPAPAPAQNAQAPAESAPENTTENLAENIAENRAAKTAPPDSASTLPPTPAPAPPLAQQGRVTDSANILGQAARTALTARLAAFEERTQHQVAIATVPTLHGEDIGAFTRDLANRWGVGRKGHDDGVLILIAPNDQQVRIAVGYGLEKTLPESLCRQIIQDHMLPAFAGGDFAGGLDKGLTALIAAMDEGKKPPNDQPSSRT
ncbi:TPM domain-containing protein [Sphingobium phenoxybenzoativorans]|uniref:TPM domain-containing protein n=1 Tax=Sphingobium phenoxybenzoativorans TaxID=1592790 RepID=A0A975Q245_9SPHN|nr:TPM domain-containing protein [Sphingobium phenoxybenzoativorans]QUT06296.1 TPM domain-containing protein [Sphingobium phenoxybenzoativorans]